MTTKSISSTKAQNNFGRVIDDATHHQTRYIVERRGVPQVVILSFDDFKRLLNDENERQLMGNILKELSPDYELGQLVGVPLHS